MDSINYELLYNKIEQELKKNKVAVVLTEETGAIREPIISSYEIKLIENRLLNKYCSRIKRYKVVDEFSVGEIFILDNGENLTNNLTNKKGQIK